MLQKKRAGLTFVFQMFVDFEKQKRLQESNPERVPARNYFSVEVEFLFVDLFIEEDSSTGGAFKFTYISDILK